MTREENELKDLVLFKLDKVLTRLGEVETSLHNDMEQIKVRLSAAESLLIDVSKAVVAMGKARHSS